MSCSPSPRFAWATALAIALAATTAQAQSGGIFVPEDSGIFVSGDESESSPGEKDEFDTKPKPKDDSPADEGEPLDDGKKGDGGRSLEERVKSVEQRLEEAKTDIRSLRSQVAENAQAIQELYMLLESDRDAEPKPNEDLPPLDADCKGEKGCYYCLLDVQDEMDELMLLFEKLQLIYSRFKNVYDRAVTYGDALSGFHGASGIAWSQVKVGLYEGLLQLQGAYDAKYKEFMHKHWDLLKKADDCLPKGAPLISKSLSARTLRTQLAIRYKRSD